MALISCPECKRKVSDTAPACPGCGAAIADSREYQASGARLTTTQETSKKLKMHTLISVTLFIIGIVSTFSIANAPEPAAWPFGVMTVGIFWYIVTRFRIWWHHK
jgi:hypothetical protein